MRLSRLAVAVVMLLMCTFLSAREPATQPGGAETQTLVYDISDLVRPRVNYPANSPHFEFRNVPMAPGMAVGAEMGGGAGGFGMAGPAGEPVPGRGEFASALVHLIQETIDPESWRENGGQTGSLRELAGQLVITQTQENQKRIQKLVSEMRQQQGPSQMVCVRAYWLMLSPQEIAGIFDATKKQGGSAVPTVSDTLPTGDKLYCQGQTICFNGQTVHTTSGRQWSVVTDVQPVVGSNAVGYDPTMSTANSGVSLQVTPQLVPDAGSAILDLRSTVTETRGPAGAVTVPNPTTQPIEQAAGAVTVIDRLNVVNQEFATTVRLPLGKKVLLGGMTLEPASKTDPGRQLYLVVELDAVK